MHPIEKWLYPAPSGLYCEPGDFYVDPIRPVDRAVITHAHSDHARPGNTHVFATRETLDVMRIRLGEAAYHYAQAAAYGQETDINGVRIRLEPAGHIFGSAQVVISYTGTCAVVSGDYKRCVDPTCAPFEIQRCNLFITEATFGLPVFRHEPPMQETLRLLNSISDNPERTHLLGVYGLGKCQRMLKLMRLAGYDAPIYLHGALDAVTQYYASRGQHFGEVRHVLDAQTSDLAGALVMCPPSALNARWSRRMTDPITAFASGWMRVRGRARQRGVELPIIISDHADWPELIDTIVETEASDVWITHGREDALVHQLTLMGRRARALSLVGYEDEAE